jgi:very-short-patch-repair endonuclease
MVKFGLIGKGTISEKHIKAIESIGGILCDYGCGKEAKYELKNGKKCCSIKFNSCTKIRERNSRSNKGKKISEQTKQKILEKWKINPPRLGKKCSKITKDRISKSIKNLWIDSNSVYHLPEVREKNRLNIIGKTHTKDGDLKISKKLKGKLKTELHKQRLSISVKKSFEKNPLLRENLSKRMKDWQCKYMLKKVKTISKEEIKLQNIVKEIFPSAIFHYKVLDHRNFEVDIAILEHKIAVEFDGYYHFNSKESIKYHSERQKEIENEGWKFIRYNVFHKFPDKEQVQKDIMGKLL